MTKLYFVEEAGELLRASPSTVRHWVYIGRLAFVKPGRRVLIPEEAIERFLSGERASLT